MSRIFDIADRYVDGIAALDPILATAIGVPGHEREMTDFSPDGVSAIAAFHVRSMAKLEAAPIEDDPAGGPARADRIARSVMLERLGVHLDLFEAGEHFRDLNNIASPLQNIPQVFDQMPRSTEEEWSNIAARLQLVPQAIAGYRRTLSEGVQRGTPAARRQALEGARQAEVWSGDAGFFAGLAARFDAAEAGPETLRADLGRGVHLAREAYAEISRWLREDYAPKATEREACGEERYQLLSRLFLGATLDLPDTYRWGWEELHRVEGEMEATAERISPGATVGDAKQLLETDPVRAVEGVEAYQEWLQQLHDETVASLDGIHFEIDEKIRPIEVMIPPAGGALIPYYTGPSEDFSRPGRTWWPVDGRTRFPKWGEVSIAYHEGVPGHHLQVAGARLLTEELTRFQRTLTFISGHGEGWALYAERLMGELGYFETPDYYLGMLSAQALRCVRVIIDIGMHLELEIPPAESFHRGEKWTHDLMLEFAVQRTQRPREFLKSEILRYLGWPAQAIAYKVGERKWLEAPESARRSAGASFSLKGFHSRALALGPMGLDMLEAELAAEQVARGT